MFSQIILYIKYRLQAGHYRGRGVHPPFAYKFISRVIFGNTLQGLEWIEELRKSLSGNEELLDIEDHGAGSKISTGEQRSLASLVKHTAVNRKKGQLLARIAGYLDFPLIVELGTGTGFSSLYLGAGNPSSTVFSCEGSPSIAELAKNNIGKSGMENIQISVDTFREWLPGVLNRNEGDFLVFLDGDHRGERLLEYCELIIKSRQRKAVIVLDDIHWSKDMFQAWKRLIEREEISLSIELYNTGIVFLGYGIQKSQFIVRF